MIAARDSSRSPQGLFAELFRDISWGEFIATYWSRRSSTLGGCEALLAKLPGLSEFPGMLAGTLTSKGWHRGVLMGRASYVDDNSQLRDIHIEAGQFAEAYSAGMSLCLSPVEHLNPTLENLAEDCRRSSEFPVGVCITAYLTPKGARGKLHFDSQHVFLLQVSGTKHWRISPRPSAFMPPTSILGEHVKHGDVIASFSSIGLPLEPPERCDMKTVSLNAGQCLYLPPGSWHEARTEDQASLHYTLTVFPVTFASLISMQMRVLMLQRDAWRSDIRFTDGQAGLLHHLQQELAELRDIVNNLSPESLCELQQRLNDLQPHTRNALGLTHGQMP